MKIIKTIVAFIAAATEKDSNQSRGAPLWRCKRPLVHRIPLGYLRCPETAMLVGVALNALPGVPESHPPVGKPRESAEGFRA